MKIILAMAAVGAAALMYGGAVSAEAGGPFSHSYEHFGSEDRPYLNVVVDILEYDVDQYADFKLVRMKLSIENLVSQTMGNIEISLGGELTTRYTQDSYEEVRSRGGDVSVDDCTSEGRFDDIPPGATGETTVCIMIAKTFEPDALQIYSSFGIWNTQIIPFHAESSYCFVNWHDNCNANNIQRVDGTPTPQPEPESEPKPATLLHAMYHNHTGILVLVFDQLVVASSPDRIHIIHDIDAFVEGGAAPDLEDTELNTADGKRQSAILAFTLSDDMRLDVTESIRTHGDLALYIDTRAVYAAEGFVDITMPDRTPILVPDITVVR